MPNYLDNVTDVDIKSDDFILILNNSNQVPVKIEIIPLQEEVIPYIEDKTILYNYKKDLSQFKSTMIFDLSELDEEIFNIYPYPYRENDSTITNNFLQTCLQSRLDYCDVYLDTSKLISIYKEDQLEVYIDKVFHKVNGEELFDLLKNEGLEVVQMNFDSDLTYRFLETDFILKHNSNYTYSPVIHPLRDIYNSFYRDYEDSNQEVDVNDSFYGIQINLEKQNYIDGSFKSIETYSDGYHKTYYITQSGIDPFPIYLWRGENQITVNNRTLTLTYDPQPYSFKEISEDDSYEFHRNCIRIFENLELKYSFNICIKDENNDYTIEEGKLITSAKDFYEKFSRNNYFKQTQFKDVITVENNSFKLNPSSTKFEISFNVIGNKENVSRKIKLNLESKLSYIKNLTYLKSFFFTI